jgi:hypothetical protein
VPEWSGRDRAGEGVGGLSGAAWIWPSGGTTGRRPVPGAGACQ